jgi:membrane-bound lytic murein transglycosylase D
MKVVVLAIIIASFALNIGLIAKFDRSKHVNHSVISKIKTGAENILDPIVDQRTFQVSAKLEPRVKFWEEIYSKYDSDVSIIHDTDNVTIVYKVMKFKYLERKHKRRMVRAILKERMIKKEKKRIRKILSKLATLKSRRRLKYSRLNRSEKEIYKKVKSVKGYSFKRASRKVRSQTGQKDMIDAALKRSNRYMRPMENILLKKGLPKELAVITFVESSFNLKANSNVGAAGVWQIMPSMGRKFLKINKFVDERRDPIKSTEVAAIILKESHKVLKNWPLAITSYNVGWPNVKKALRRSKGRTLDDLIRSRHSRMIGFASKNFYAEFIAMLNVYSNYRKFFKKKDDLDPISYKYVTFKKDVRLRDVLFGAKVDLKVFKELNPEFRRNIIVSKSVIPKGTKVKFPRKTKRLTL